MLCFLKIRRSRFTNGVQIRNQIPPQKSVHACRSSRQDEFKLQLILILSCPSGRVMKAEALRSSAVSPLEQTLHVCILQVHVYVIY